MRLLIFTLFLTFVGYNQSQGAPSNLPKLDSTKVDLQKTDSESEDFEKVYFAQNQAQLGYLYGSIYSSENAVNRPILGYGRKIELAFEKHLLLGAVSDLSNIVGFYVRSPLQNLDYFENSFYDSLEIGLFHFIDGNDGISNLVNINHTKISFGYTFFELFNIQLLYGFYGLGAEAHLLWGF